MSDPSADQPDPQLSQKSRALRIATPLEGSPLLLTGFSGAEALSQLFRFEMTFVSEVDDIDFADVLGQSATVTVDLPDSTSRSWNGIVTQFSQTGRDDDFTYYAGVLEPALVLLGLRTDYRIFQAQKVDDILDTLLADVTVKKCYAHADDRQPHNYRVQYGESDLAFVSRLMEEAGLFYYFEHDAENHTLVLCDDSTQLADTSGLSAVNYRGLEGGVQKEQAITRWRKTQRLASTEFLCRDTHFQMPRKTFEAKRSVSDSVTFGTLTHKPNPADKTLTLYTYPGGYAARYDSVGLQEQDPDPSEFENSPIKNIATDAETEARLESELVACQAVAVSAASDVLALAPGAVFTLKGHYNGDGKYLATRVAHAVELGIGFTSAPSDESLKYENEFNCQPFSLPFRAPRVTPKPVINGVQTAMVVADSTDNEADREKLTEQFYDMYGRVKVWFPWDRRPEAPAEGAAPDGAAKPADRSCWVRVAQFWAGEGWGAFFWPRHGHEVLVAFEHGDPDRPVIVGSLYNAKNLPPMKMPLQQELSGVKSCSVRGNPAVNYNGFTFHDELDNEHLELHSEAHTISYAEQSQHTFVRGTAVRVFGSMFGDIGSGAGGGPSKVSNLIGQQAAATRKWVNQWRASRFESDINVTLGHTASITGGFPLGTSNEIVQGGKLEMVLDPSGWIDNETIQKIQDLVVPMGEWSGLFGAGRSLHYGPSMNVRHGSDISRRTKKAFDESNPRTAWVGGIVTAATALTLLGWSRQKNDPVTWESLVKSLGPRGVSGVLLNLLLEFEKANGECDAGIEKQNEASSLTEHADALGADYAQLVLDLAGKATDQGATLSSAGQEDLSKQQQDASSEDTSVDDAESEPDSPPDDGQDASADDSTPSAQDQQPQDVDGSDVSFGSDDADVYECYDGLLATGARHISLRARASEDDDSEASLIHLDARGGDGEDNGVVAITSSGQATMVCGPASFQIRRDGTTGQIDATTGDDGTITLTTGGDSGSRAVLDPDSITLSVGAEGSGAVITMTSDGIKLSVGPDGGPCLELTTSGVKMSCGANNVAVDQSGQTTEGMNISHKADMAYEAKGTMASLEGSAQTTVKGAITMIN